LNLSFASVGTGLTGAEVSTLSVLTHTFKYSVRGLSEEQLIPINLI
jgi:hypothetical protein